MRWGITDNGLGVTSGNEDNELRETNEFKSCGINLNGTPSPNSNVSVLFGGDTKAAHHMGKQTSLKLTVLDPTGTMMLSPRTQPPPKLTGSLVMWEIMDPVAPILTGSYVLRTNLSKLTMNSREV